MTDKKIELNFFESLRQNQKSVIAEVPLLTM